MHLSVHPIFVYRVENFAYFSLLSQKLNILVKI